MALDIECFKCHKVAARREDGEFSGALKYFLNTLASLELGELFLCQTSSHVIIIVSKVQDMGHILYSHDERSIMTCFPIVKYHRSIIAPQWLHCKSFYLFFSVS